MDNLTSLPRSISNDVSNTVNAAVTEQLNKLFSWIVVPLIIITAIIVIAYTYRAFRRRKIENAILEIRDTLRVVKLSQQPSPPLQVAEPTVSDQQ